MLKSNNPNIEIENIIQRGMKLNTYYELTEDSYTYILPNVKNITLEGLLQQLHEEVDRNGMQDSIVEFLKSILDNVFGEINSTMDYLNITKRKIEFDKDEIRKKLMNILEQHADSKYQYLIDLDLDPIIDDFKAEGEDEEFYNEDGTFNQEKYIEWLLNGGYTFSKSDIVSFLNSGHIIHLTSFDLMDVINDEAGNLNPFNQLIFTFEGEETDYIFYLDPIKNFEASWIGQFKYINSILSEEIDNKGYPYQYTTKGDLIVTFPNQFTKDDRLMGFLRDKSSKIYIGNLQPSEQPEESNTSSEIDIDKTELIHQIKENQHNDEIHSLFTCVDDFSLVMKSRLLDKYMEGRYGWDDPDWPISEIQEHIFTQISKGNFVNIANFAMFGWNQVNNIKGKDNDK